jgi:hypothetical protein
MTPQREERPSQDAPHNTQVSRTLSLAGSAQPKHDRYRGHRDLSIAMVRASKAWKTLNATERKYTLYMLRRFANPDRDGAMFPSKTTLSTCLKQTERNVVRVLKSLVAKGVFVVSREPEIPTNVYRLSPAIVAETAEILFDLRDLNRKRT